MNEKILGLMGFLVLAALTASAAASAQEMTYDFTGIVTSSGFSSVTTGMTITGTYTFDLTNAYTATEDYSYDGIGQLPWSRGVGGGAADSRFPAPTATVFSSIATAGSTVFPSYSPSPFGGVSSVASGGGFAYFASDTEYTSSSSFLQSAFVIIGNGLIQPWTNDTGMPILAAGSTGTGSIREYNAGVYGPEVDYSISSIARAPEIDPASAASGLTLLLGGVVVLRGRRKVVA
jgi:hypothetical protein